MDELANNVKAPPPEFDQAEWDRRQADNQSVIDELWRNLRCKGSARTRRNTEATLQRISKEKSFEWVMPAWRWGSTAVHMLGSDFLFRDRGDGSSDLVWSLPSQRAGWLALLAGAYANALSVGATVVDRDKARERVQAFSGTVDELIRDPGLRRIMAGAFDPG